MTSTLMRSGSALLFREGQMLNRPQFWAAAAAMAESWPSANYYFNLCQHRDDFMLSFAAGLIAGKTALLPPSTAPALLQDLADSYDTTVVASSGNQQLLARQQSISPELYWQPSPGVNEMPELVPEQIAAVAFTSGSTGKPSAHPKRWSELLLENEMACQRLFSVAKQAMAIVATVPPQHMYGLETTVLTALQGNCLVHAARPMLPTEVAAALNEMPSPRVLVSTPAHLRVLLGSAQAYPSLEKIVSATAPLSEQMAAELEAKFNCPVYEIYGCTEAGSMASRRTTETESWRLYPQMSLQQIDNKTIVKGPQLPEPVLLNDAISLVSEDRFRLMGRNSDLVNVAGKRASLADLSLKLLAIPGVEDAVFFQPEPDKVTARLAALVVAPSLDKASLRSALRQHVDAVFLPRPLRLVERLPRNASGKLSRASLLEMLKQPGQKHV